jgi:hypothetical protein
MKRIFPILVANHYKRAMVLGTCSFPARQDKGALKWKASTLLIKIIGGSAYDEFKGLGVFVTSQDISQLKWTLFRVPFLNNGPKAAGSDGMFLSRASLAAWVIDQISEDSDWVAKSPLLSN